MLHLPPSTVFYCLERSRYAVWRFGKSEIFLKVEADSLISKFLILNAIFKWGLMVKYEVFPLERYESWIIWCPQINLCQPQTIRIISIYDSRIWILIMFSADKSNCWILSSKTQLWVKSFLCRGKEHDST